MNTDIKFLEYKPSTVAAASLIYASYELFPQQYSILRATVTTSEHIDKVSLVILNHYLIFIYYFLVLALNIGGDCFRIHWPSALI
jgi:hypothetical protein